MNPKFNEYMKVVTDLVNGPIPTSEQEFRDAIMTAFGVGIAYGDLLTKEVNAAFDKLPEENA